jgi:hypothetical protein
MSYSTPKTWAHGDTVPAAEMQKYSDGLDAIKPLFPTVVRNFAIAASQYEDTQEFWITHKARWLIYKSTGVIRHPLDPTTYPDVSLSDTDTINAFDIDNGVDWLVPGALYKVIGCSVCFEDEVGIIV